jgi:ATP-binding cassette, subfamily B, bacterial
MMTTITISDELWVFTESLFELMKESGDFKASFSILKKPQQSLDKPSAKAHKIKSADIEFKNVSFKYGSDKHVFENLNLSIPCGQKVGIVGRSGAGKSTLTSLLLKNFLATSGSIIIDGINIKEYTADSIRSQISLIPQDILLFNRTIAENIGYSKENPTLEEIKKAAKLANLDSFIEELPKKYKTVVGERGVKISGGQRQRIAIARASLKDAPIVILDEATSSLDTITEQEIQASINNILNQEDKTIITIAHRLSSIKHMERIIVIEDGVIIEDGNFKQLMANEKGRFKELWKNQNNNTI